MGDSMGALPSQKYEEVLMAFCFYLEHQAIIDFDKVDYDMLIKDFLRKCDGGDIYVW